MQADSLPAEPQGGWGSTVLLMTRGQFSKCKSGDLSQKEAARHPWRKRRAPQRGRGGRPRKAALPVVAGRRTRPLMVQTRDASREPAEKHRLCLSASPRPRESSRRRHLSQASSDLHSARAGERVGRARATHMGRRRPWRRERPQDPGVSGGLWSLGTEWGRTHGESKLWGRHGLCPAIPHTIRPVVRVISTL